MNIILILSLLIGLGFVFGKLASRIGLPTVSGYLVAGLIIGVFSGIVPLIPIDYEKNKTTFNILSEITLSFIAFGIGSEFLFSKLKKSGKTVVLITIMEVIGAIGVVFLAMYLFVPFTNMGFNSKERLSFSLIIATMSAATAPAATIMVIRQFRTKGPVTDTILPVAALDDVIGIIAFGLVLPIARILTPVDPSNVMQLTFWNIVKGPIVEVFGSIAVGIALGFLLSLFSKQDDPRDELQVKTIFFVLVGLGLSQLLGLSSLLVNIAVGTMLVNLRENSDRSFRIINNFVPVFYILFFAIAGATLELDVLVTVGLIGVIYVVARAVGKILGAYTGSSIAKADPNVKKYLGFALLPQGGISIGLSLMVQQHLAANVSQNVVTIILFSILIYESSGPIFAKLALKKADELYKLDFDTVNDELDENFV